MPVMLYFFFNFLDTKSMAAALADFTVISYVKLKLPTIIRDTVLELRVLIEDQSSSWSQNGGH